jgi:hypothetical protein
MRSFLLFIFLFTASLLRAQPVPNPKDIRLTESLMGKWKYDGEASRLFPDSLEFLEDSILKVASLFDKKEHHVFRTYRYYVKANNIHLLSWEEDPPIHIAKLGPDSLRIDWNKNGIMRLNYYRIK